VVEKRRWYKYREKIKLDFWGYIAYNPRIESEER